MTSPLSEQNSGYRQGIVLGLTMAEVLLLLVFILLLVTGGMIQRFRDENAIQKKYIVEIKRRLQTADALTQQLNKFKDIKSTPEDVRTAIAIVENLRDSSGIGPKAMIEVVKSFAEQIKLGAPEIPQDWQKLVRAEQQLKTLTELLKTKGYVVDPSKDLSEVLKDSIRDAGQGRINEWPPMIRLSEADGHYFSLGKAKLSPEFEAYIIKEVIPALIERIKQYDVDVIEVVGHTDQVPMSSQPSTLDTDLRGALAGTLPVDDLVSGDNAGLGIARAVAVVRVLLNDRRLDGIRILPLSGAQLTTLDEKLDTDPNGFANVKERRRIEIRMRRSTQAQSLTPAQ